MVLPALYIWWSVVAVCLGVPKTVDIGGNVVICLLWFNMYAYVSYVLYVVDVFVFVSFEFD